MTIWALSDLHLNFGTPSKSMEVFGDSWKNYAERIKAHWLECIQPEDLVLIPGDISWGKNMDEALIDLNWIDALPGTKLILKGNHDYWWDSPAKMLAKMPPSIHFIQNNAFNWEGVTIGGARLWDTPEYSFGEYIHYVDNPREKKKPLENLEDIKAEQEKIFVRDLERLKLSLVKLDPKAKIRIALTHYPPISADLKDSKASKILEEFKIDICVFGHLHNVVKKDPFFGEKNGVRYVFASCDFLEFIPLRIL